MRLRTRWATTVGSTAAASLLLRGRIPRALWWLGVLGACSVFAWRMWCFLQRPDYEASGD